ncbi:hypothetical protein BC830DRAFT_646162 [Chytriomyces sp. MP71]|nr:hypothetical protein BC830DRAFT_646162 [Chytriomyces sp. MP71]
MIPGGRRVRLLVAVVVAALGLLFVASMSGMLHTGFMQRTGVVSSPTDVKASNGQGATVTHRKPRIMYYNTHPGTQVNFEYIMSRLGLQFIRFNPTVIRDSNAMQAPRAKELIEGGFAASLCMGVDVIVISDTFPHARPLIASLIAEKEEHRCLDTHLVPELTNRFDWGVADAQETYYPMIWRVNWPGSKVNNLHWTENNPFESRNLADQTMATPEFRLLRPVGHTSVKPLALTRAETKLVAVFADGNEYSPLRYIMEALNIPHKVLPRHYGGPHTLAKYRAYIELPYQVSTMKLYENLAAGVVMLFPSPAFFQELVCKDYIWFLPTGEIFRTGDPNVGPDWTKYMDYFHTDLSDYFYYFDSWEHLKQILSADVVDTKNVKSNGPKFYETVRLKTLHGWAELLGSFGFEVLVDGEPKRSDVAIDAPYRNTLPASIKTAPNSVDDFQTQYNVLKQWKDDRGNSRMKLERQAKATMNALDLGALQFKKYYHEKPGKGLFLGFSSELNLVDETLVRLQDSLNGATEVPASNQDIDFLLKLSTKLSEYSYLSETGYRSFAQTARILQSLHAIAVNGENVRVALKGIPETTIKKLKDSFNIWNFRRVAGLYS